MGEPPWGSSSYAEDVELPQSKGVIFWNGYHFVRSSALTYEFFAGLGRGTAKQRSRQSMSFIGGRSIARLGNKYMVFKV